MSSTDQETVFASGSALRSPFQLLRSMYVDIFAARELSFQILRRDFQARYRESFLGFAWAFVPTIAMVLALTFAARVQLLNAGPLDVPYPVFVIVGTVLWQLFVDSLNAPTAAVAAARSIITKVRFPRAALLIAKLGELLVDFMIKLIIVFAVLVYFGVEPGPYVWLFPLGVLPLIALGMTIGILMVPMAVIFQDLFKGFTLAVGYWFFLTPVAYSMPENELFRKVISLNPVTPFLVTAREMILSSRFTFWDSFIILTPLVFVALFLGWVFLYVAMPALIERMSA